jgi:hypothetical protein
MSSYTQSPTISRSIPGQTTIPAVAPVQSAMTTMPNYASQGNNVPLGARPAWTPGAASPTGTWGGNDGNDLSPQVKALMNLAPVAGGPAPATMTGVRPGTIGQTGVPMAPVNTLPNQVAVNPGVAPVQGGPVPQTGQLVAPGMSNLPPQIQALINQRQLANNISGINPPPNTGLATGSQFSNVGQGGGAVPNRFAPIGPIGYTPPMTSQPVLPARSS